MKRLTHFVLAFAMCTLAMGPGKALAKTTYTAQLTGREEVPPNDTNASGLVTLHVNKAQTQITYKVVVGNIDNVTAAHIHLGARGTTGPVVATLFGPVAAGGGKKSGILTEGTITAASLTGDLAGHTLLDLIAAFDAGNAYVNVHTDDGSAGSTGKGDFPDGEIRGQVH